jgi:hypothetical protein
VLQYILDLRERLREALSLASDYAKSESIIAQRFGMIEKRERVLLSQIRKIPALVPRPNKPLQMQYYGPYEVLERLGQIDRRIVSPHRLKTERIFRVSLLELYLERDVHGSNNF